MIRYADIVSLAIEKDPVEKIRLASQAFLDTTVFTGLAVSYVPNGDDRHHFLYSHGYSDDALSYLGGVFIPTNPFYRQVVADPSKILTGRDSRFANSEVPQTWLVPVGYRNGFSISVQSREHGEIGSLHANSYATDFGDHQFDGARAFGTMLNTLLTQKRARDTTRLTPRETRVVQLIAEGASNPEIADLLSLSRSTVATHVENILRKLGVRSRVGIAVEGTRLGLV